MDYKIIEDEIYNFCSDFFEEVSIITEDNVDFIEDNQLHIPKENYAVLNNFLQKTLNNFKILDPTFCSSTLDKLGRDLIYLNNIYNETNKKTANISKIFESKFIPQSSTLTNFAKSILEFSDLADKTSDEIFFLKKMKKDYLQLKEIFFTNFEEIFNDDKKYYMTSLKSSINIKCYYLDKLLWKEADESIAIVKHFSIRKLDEKLNSKDYILFTTALMRPYTEEYKYLQTCLRVFK